MNKNTQETTATSSTGAIVRLVDIWNKHFGQRIQVDISEAENFFQEVNDNIVFNEMSVEDRKKYLKMIGVSPA